MFEFTARSQGTHILSTTNFAEAERRAKRHASRYGKATVLTSRNGKRYRINRYSGEYGPYMEV